MQRFFDIVFSLIALIVLLPLLLPVMLILKFTGENDIFYVQQRVGRGAKHFGLLKFATMLRNSPNIGTGTVTLKGDPRVLPFGKFLRKTKINELPQLLNILRGDMSVIGPRPLTPNGFDLYSPETKLLVAQVRPGLSGVGSIVFRDEEQIMHGQPDPANFHTTVITPYKGKLEEWYVRNQSLWLYFKCIFLTAWVVLFPSSKVAQRVLNGLPVPSPELAAVLN